MLLIDGQDAQVAEWAGRCMGTQFVGPLSALGIVEPDGKLRGAAIFNDFQGTGGNIELTLIGPGALTPSVMRGIAEYAFVHCNAARMSCKTRRDNIYMRKLLGQKRHGFRFEGVSPRYYDTEKGGDALRFVLFKEDAKRWLGH